MSDEGIETLARHLESLDPEPRNWEAWTVDAETILANPQAHIDALVEAGVLEGSGSPATCGCVKSVGWHYKLVKPHVHDWRIVQVYGDEKICLRCDGCSQREDVPQEPRGEKPKWMGEAPNA
jgi:hypothetical protein